MSRSIVLTWLGVLILASSFAKAEVTKSNEVKVPLRTTQWIPCASGSQGEVVELQGYLHILSFQQNNDNNTSWHFHVTTQYARAFGQTTGLEYRVTGSPLVEAAHYASDGTPDVYKLIWFRHIVGEGTNFVITELIHITINANGTTTVEMRESHVSCQ